MKDNKEIREKVLKDLVKGIKNNFDDFWIDMNGNLCFRQFIFWKIEGYQEIIQEKDKELKELQDTYNIAMKEIAKLRRKLGYDKKKD